MKRKVLILIALGVISIAVLFNACKQNDTTPPIITLKGGYSITLSLNAIQPPDPGYTAIDNTDGAVTATSNWGPTNPNINLAGTYYILYSATDKAGNTGTATRTVIVQNDASFLAGLYTDSLFKDSMGVYVIDTAFTQTITASDTINKRILFSMFHGYINDSTLYATVTIGDSTADSVYISMQTISGIGLGGCTHIFSPNGSGQPITQNVGKYLLSVFYYDQELAGGAGCPGYAATPFKESLNQQ